ncbi:hypothetical protein TNCV_839001, partial [Trichonephila clavipes]
MVMRERKERLMGMNGDAVRKEERITHDSMNEFAVKDVSGIKIPWAFSPMEKDVPS